MVKRKPAEKKPIAPLLYTADIAKMTGWQTQRVRRLLKRMGVLSADGRNYYTTRERLARACPAIWEALESRVPTED